MSSDFNTDLGDSLRQLKVVQPQLDRDRLLYEAGRRSMQQSFLWPMSTAASLLLAVTVSWLYWQQSNSAPSQAMASFPDLVIELTKSPPPTLADPVEPSNLSYLTLREESVSMKPVTARSAGVDLGQQPLLSAASYSLMEWQRW